MFGKFLRRVVSLTHKLLGKIFPNHVAWESKILHAFGIIRADTAFRIEIQNLTFFGDEPPEFPVRHTITTETLGGDPLPFARRNAQISYLSSIEPTEITKTGLIFTPSGISWQGMSIDAASSTVTPGSVHRLILSLRRKNQERIESGTVIQAEFCQTYGDWITCFMKPLVLADEIRAPLLLPVMMKGRPYISTDLERLGISYKFCDRSVRVAECKILKRRTTHLVWTRGEVEKFQERMNITPPKPESGSILYLSRVGLKSEHTMQMTRNTRSELIENIVEALGGKVVRTQGLSFDDFSKLASRAEMVLADHGAALLNLLQWKSKNVIEFAAEDWWMSCCLSLSKAVGVERHTIIRPAQHNEKQLMSLIEAASKS